MAVVQISRIQIRRGKSLSGTGIPQLASGELAWALDTQELYIGNGAVAEGAPAVGNTKVLTELDLGINGNVLNIVQYGYKIDIESGIQTGADMNSPVLRRLQDRLDDRVNVTDFGAVGDGVTLDTEALQRAIDQLFLNTATSKSSNTSPDGVLTRRTLEIPAGTYYIDSTLYVPSYATLAGAGSDKTIIYFAGTGPAIQFVNDNSLPGEPDDISNTQNNTQPRNISLTGMTVFTDTADQAGLQLDAVRDSLFEDVVIKGSYTGTYDSNACGIVMNAPLLSSIVTCERNTFRNVTVTGFSIAVFSNQDIIGNTFTNCYFTNLVRGFVLGEDSNPGLQSGPRQTLIDSCRFELIERHAVLVTLGTGNTVAGCTMIDVGNNNTGTGNVSAVWPQVFFAVNLNSCVNLQSDRATYLANPEVEYVETPYVPEVSGHGTYSSYSQRLISITDQVGGWNQLFRLPVATHSDGTPINSISYVIDYRYQSGNTDSIRTGTLDVVVNSNNGVYQLSDDYVVSGISEYDATLLAFRVRLLDQTGALFTSAYGQQVYSIQIQYTNPTSDVGELVYSYTSSF